MSSQNTRRPSPDDHPRLSGHALPPIRTFLGTELSLPLPPSSSPWDRPHWSHRDLDIELQRSSPPSRPRAFTFSSPHLHAPPPPPPLPLPSPGRRSFPPSSRPHRSPSHSAPVAPPAFAYNVLRPSRSGTLITSVPTVRARSRSMPQPPFHHPPTSTTSTTSSTPTSRAESEGGARRHVCALCQKRFNRPSSLRTHLNTHTGERPFGCPHPGCDKVFSVMSNMRRHQQRVHGQGGVEDDGSLRGGEVDSDGDVYMEEPEREANYEWAAAYEGPAGR